MLRKLFTGVVAGLAASLAVAQGITKDEILIGAFGPTTGPAA